MQEAAVPVYDVGKRVVRLFQYSGVCSVSLHSHGIVTVHLVEFLIVGIGDSKSKFL